MSRFREIIILAIACFAPWAFGSVEAWAQLVLYCGIALVTILGVFDRQPGLARRLSCLPSLAMIGLVLLAIVQVMPLPPKAMQWLAPSMETLRADVLPEHADRVVGDPAPPVPLPARTLSQQPHETVQTAAQLAAGWLLFQAVLGLGGGPATYRRFGLTMAVNATALALFSVIQALTWNGQIFWIGPERPGSPWSGGGPFVCHSHLAEYLNIGLGFALGFLLVDERFGLARARGKQAWAAYAAGAITVGIVTSHSRGGFLAMLGALSVTLVLMRARSTRIWAGVAAMIAIVALLLTSLGDASPYQRRLATIWDSGDGGYAIRSEIRAGALRAWRDYPVWGTGLGTFAAATTPYYDRVNTTFFSRAENEYVDLLTEGGVLGLGLAIAAVIGTGRLTRRALTDAATSRDRALIFGGIFGLVAIGLHSLSDFGMHVPGVAVPAVILAAHLCRQGLISTEASLHQGRSSSRMRTIGSVATGTAIGLATSALGVTLVAHGERNTFVEALLTEADLPPPGARMPTASLLDAPEDELELKQLALETAVQLWPDWSEGHLRLGLVHLARYKQTAATWLDDAATNQEVELMSDPLWLFSVFHAGEPFAPETLLSHEPIRMHLVPAARSFLEARRCSPVSSLAHANLASLDYLLEGGEPPFVHLARALALAGNDGSVILYSAQVAVQCGELELAALAWRHALMLRDGRWRAVADAAAAVLTPDEILEAVIPDGQSALRFAERLYAGPEYQDVRSQYYQAALDLLPDDQDLGPAERLYLEGRSLAALGQQEAASDRMTAALALDPLRPEWRNELITRLLDWGDINEAHAQALVWSHLSPDDAAARKALDRTAEARARGGRQ